MIITELKKSKDKNPELHIKVILDENIYTNVCYGGDYAGIGKEIASIIADQMFEKVSKKVMSDPDFMIKITNHIYSILGKKLLENIQL